MRSGIFSFDGDCLFVDATGGHSHRRATSPELRSHFDRRADRPAHWYEAQVIHYGLPSSRVKGTAKMRLHGAVREGDIRVPGYLKSMEQDLRREWMVKTMEEDARRERIVVESRRGAPSAKKRRNAERGFPAAKSRRMTSTTAPRERTLSPHDRGRGLEVNLAPGDHTGQGPAWKAKQEYGDEDWDIIPFSGVSIGLPKTRVPDPSGPWVGSVPAQGAAPVGFQSPQGTGHPPSYGRDVGLDSFDDYPFPAEPAYIVGERNYLPAPASLADQPMGYNTGGHGPRPRLRLINGRYDIPVAYNDGPKHSLTLTLDGKMVWGFLELGDLTGVIQIAQRPYNASGEMLDLVWRGYYTEYGVRRFHDGTRQGSGQYLSFLGGGEIRGLVRFGGGGCHEFTGLE